MINPVPSKDSQVAISLVRFGGLCIMEEILSNGCSLHILFIQQAFIGESLFPLRLVLGKKTPKLLEDSPELQFL